ncbi:MAG: ThiF family adenylyltransferase [Planctomycetota bacterium]
MRTPSEQPRPGGAGAARNARYARQARLPEWGEQGQARLESAHVVIVGVGGLGCPAADALARAGVARITLIDRDLVDETNLHRQVLYTDADAGEHTPKAVAAAARLHAVNPGVRALPVIADVTSANAESLIMGGAFGPPDVLVDGLDGFETRLLINDVAVKHGVALVYGGAVATRGAHGLLVAPALDGLPRACLRCVLGDVPPAGSQPTCDTAGVLGPLVAIVGSQQAAEVLRLLALRRPSRELVSFDLLAATRGAVDLAGAHDPACPCCVRRAFRFLDAPPPAASPGLCGREAVQIEAPRAGEPPDLDAVARSWAGLGSVRSTPMMARLRLEQSTVLTLFADGRAIVEGTTDPAAARALYARYVGG